jgi:hypothetical protein
MVFYTLVVSFPFLVFLFVRDFLTGGFCFLLFGVDELLVVFIFVFIVKLPVFGVHL